MLKSLLSYNPIPKNLLALEQAEQDDKPIVLGIEAQLKKGELDVNQVFTSKDLGQLPIKKTASTTSLVITDSNILTKEIYNTGSDDEIVSDAFPNLNLEDFYYQILRTETKSFIAVCRKQYVDSLIEQYRKEKIRITEIALGNLKIAALSSYAYNSELISYSALTEIDSTSVLSIKTKKKEIIENYEIDSITIPSTHTLPFALILDSLSDTTKISGNIEEKNTQLRSEFKEIQLFKNILQFGVGLLLFTLLINFFIFNSKYKTWQNLQEELQVYTTQKESIDKQQSIISAKEAIVNSILTTGFSRSSYYIDQIIQLLPITVILESFAYQPIAKTVREDKSIQLKENTISITGNTTDKADFTTWLNTLENLKFITKVTIISYGVDKNNTSAFEILLNYISDDTTK